MTGLADGDRRQDAMNQTYLIGGDGSAVTVPSTHPSAAVAGTNPGPVKGLEMAPRPEPWRLPMKATAGPRPWRLQPF